MKKLVAIAVFLAAGCAVGPDYRRPQAVVPVQYKELEGWRQALPSDGAPRGSWWLLFGDAELDDLMRRVDVSNQTIRVAEARLRQAKALADQARAGLYPTLGAKASATRVKGPVNSYSATLNADWELDLWGKVRRSVEAGDAAWQASTADLEGARLSARAALAQAYFSLRVSDVNRRLLETTVAAYQRNLELTQNRYTAGVVARVDVIQAEQQLKGAQAQLIDVRVSRAQFEHAIAILIGEVPANFALAPVDGLPAMPGIPVALPSSLLERRPDIAAAERSTAAANARIGVAKAAYFPTLTLSGAAGYGSTSLSDLFMLPNRLWSIGASATQPLFDAGLRRAQTEEKIGQYDEAVATYRHTVLTAFQQVEDNLAALRILEEEAAVQAEVVAAARKSVELTTNQYQAGVVSFLNVIITQAAQLNAEQNAANVLGRRLNASVALVQALGGGWNAEELKTVGE